MFIKWCEKNVFNIQLVQVKDTQHINIPLLLYQNVFQIMIYMYPILVSLSDVLHVSTKK